MDQQNSLARSGAVTIQDFYPLPTPLTDQQALDVIAKLTGDDFCEDLDMRAAAGKLRGDMRIAHDKLDRIYRIAHSMLQSACCFDVHGDWREEARRTWAALRSEQNAAD